MQTLVIYEEVPENTRLYLIPSEAAASLNLAVMAGTYVNASDLTADQQEVHDRFSVRTIKDKDDPNSGDWAKYQIPTDKVHEIKGPVRIIHTGFLM